MIKACVCHKYLLLVFSASDKDFDVEVVIFWDVDTTVGGVGVGAGVATGDPVPIEFSETIPGDCTLTARLSAERALGSPPMLTEIWNEILNYIRNFLIWSLWAKPDVVTLTAWQQKPLIFIY